MNDDAMGKLLQEAGKLLLQVVKVRQPNSYITAADADAYMRDFDHWHRREKPAPVIDMHKRSDGVWEIQQRATKTK